MEKSFPEHSMLRHSRKAGCADWGQGLCSADIQVRKTKLSEVRSLQSVGTNRHVGVPVREDQSGYSCPLRPGWDGQIKRPLEAQRGKDAWSC